MKAHPLDSAESLKFLDMTSGLHDALLSEFNQTSFGFILSFSEYYVPEERGYNEDGCYIIIITSVRKEIEIDFPRMIHRLEIDPTKGVSITSIDGCAAIACDISSSVIIF